MSEIYPPTTPAPSGATGLPDLGSLPVYQNRQFLDSLWTAAENNASTGTRTQMEINRQNTNALRANNYLPPGWTNVGIIDRARQRSHRQQYANNISGNLGVPMGNGSGSNMPAPVQTVVPPGYNPGYATMPGTALPDTWTNFMNGGAG